MSFRKGLFLSIELGWAAFVVWISLQLSWERIGLEPFLYIVIITGFLALFLVNALRVRVNDRSVAITDAISILEEVKSDYAEIRGTFDVRPEQISEQLDLNAKLDMISDKLDSITEQTRKLTPFERIKEAILSDVIGRIIAFAIGIIIITLIHYM